MPRELTELSEIAFKHGSDKCPQLKKYSYTDYYFDLLSPRRLTIKKVLEIGVHDGADLRMWRDFFPNAQIYSTTTLNKGMINEDRITTLHCNTNMPSEAKALIDKIGSDIDIVIDDNTHLAADQIATCINLMPHLSKDTVYIIEDVLDTKIRESLARYNTYIPNIGNTIRTPDNTLVIVGYRKGEKTSILVPSRGENFEISPGTTVLQRTVQDIYDKATGNFEVLVGFDGPPYQDFPDYPNLKVIKYPDVVGIKTMINSLAAMAHGKYIYKTDSHCSFGKGFDEILQYEMEEDWIVMPRFYVLSPSTWEWQDSRFYDYFYICCPFTDPRGLRFKAGGHWPKKTAEKLDIPIDETPQIHGSGWFMSKDYYFNTIGGFPNIDPYGHAQEPIWLALKNWLGGGRVMVNKKTWYAHMHQQANNRGYTMDNRQTKISYSLAANYWLGNKWTERKHDFEWFVDKFMPMPTWPDNWKELYNDWRKTQ
ncbi:hypothetical protein C4564_04555 [Candidatus Microgenomates bacterium]|nr:MAG: hypothetical protein C4564_04555 [Candidatus Microgenomates bacterium]